MPDQIYIGVNTVVVHDGKILMGKRLNMVGDGTWGVPGGHLFPGETIQGGARRKLLGEAGLTPKKMELLTIVNQPTQPQSDRHYIHFVFLVTEFEGEPKNFEPEFCGGWEWIDPANVPDEIFFAHKVFLKALQDRTLLYDPDPTF